MTKKSTRAGVKPPPAKRTVRKDAPKNLAETARLISEIGKLLRASEREAKRKASQVARLRDAMQSILDDVASAQAPLLAEAERLASLVCAYANEHKAELTENGAYTTAKFPSGSTIVWYQSPRSVQIPDDKAFISEVNAKRGDFKDVLLRTIVEPNREAMLMNEDVVKGMATASIVRQGRFEIHPGNTETHMQLPDENPSWLVVPPKKRKAKKKKASVSKTAKR